MTNTLTDLEGFQPWQLEAARNPEWEKCQRVHDWRNHVPDAFVLVWDKLSEETRFVIVVMADEQASRERWD